MFTKQESFSMDSSPSLDMLSKRGEEMIEKLYKKGYIQKSPLDKKVASNEENKNNVSIFHPSESSVNTQQTHIKRALTATDTTCNVNTASSSGPWCYSHTTTKRLRKEPL
ncbi:hypothetical protein TKK_0017001 [Trichogramma kaykai]